MSGEFEEGRWETPIEADTGEAATGFEDVAWEPVGEGHAIVYDGSVLEEDEDRNIKVICPECGTFVAELPGSEVFGQLTCPNCEEEFDLG